MKNKLFKSSLANTNFENLSKEKQLEILLEKNIFTEYKAFSFSKEEFNTNKGKVRAYAKINVNPSQELIDEFYTYILGIFKDELDTCFFMFFKNFNEEVFGMERAKQKVLGLEVFKQTYNEIDVKDVNLIQKEISADGIEHIKAENKLQRLKYQRNAKKNNIAKYESLVAYLIGDEGYFKSLEFLKDEVSEDILTFESYLKVLISLNDRYKFEENFTFGAMAEMKEIFKRHNALFISFDVFKFTHNFIKNLSLDIPSNIDSLHHALLELNLISKTKKRFIDYVNTEHNTSITKLRNPARDVNRSHDFRVKKLKQELQNIPSNF